tara:strand:- start:65 stop:325 length:261 start_codon:yes stop_codon:yes gene_type:complete
MKYALYNTSSDWNAKNSALETALGIPNGQGTDKYAEISKVENSENADYGKFIMPVFTLGTWKCDDQFDSNELVDFDPTWNPLSSPE